MEDRKIYEIISQLTVNEKAQLLAQIDGRYGKCERLGIAGINPQDNPRGGQDYFRSGKGTPDDGDYHPVAYPSAATMGMSWDRELSYQVGKAMAKAAKANRQYIHCLNRPGVNIKRSPLCGRNFEYYSEDPVLTGEMGAAYIQGVQSENVSACLKHYVANNQEFERMTTNSVMSERTLREVYLRVFEIAIKKGDPWMIMTSYNKLNGEWVNSNSHAMEVLREEFDYKGVVVSDFLAIHNNKIAAHKNQMDIELAPGVIHIQELLEAIQMGTIKEEQVDESLFRILKLYFQLAESEGEEIQPDLDEEHEKARAAAEKSIVLLENDGILPLEANDQKILVAGQLAVDPSYMGGGSGHMNGYKVDQPLEMIRKYCPTADFVSAYELHVGYPPVDVINETLIEETVSAAKEHDIVLFFGGYGYGYEAEGWDREDILLPESQQRVLAELMEIKAKVILVTVSGAAIDLSAYKGNVAASIYAGYAGESFGSAVANILFGKAEPGGRLAETFPMCIEHTPAYLNFSGNLEDQQDVMYGEGVFVGYRWYDARKLQTAYPFGHGLSYTEFEIQDFQVSEDCITPKDTIEISVNIKNIGKRAGSQVLQLYVRDQKCITKRPVKELKTFEKVYLEPGEEKTVQMMLDHTAFEFFSNSQERWVVEDGMFDLMLGLSAECIVAQKTIEMTGGDQVFVYNQMTPLVWFIKNPKFFQILEEEFPQEKQFVFDVTKCEFTTLLYPAPFHRLQEPTMGEPIFTQSEIDHIINRMNERN